MCWGRPPAPTPLPALAEAQRSGRRAIVPRTSWPGAPYQGMTGPLRWWMSTCPPQGTVGASCQRRLGCWVGPRWPASASVPPQPPRLCRVGCGDWHWGPCQPWLNCQLQRCCQVRVQGVVVVVAAATGLGVALGTNAAAMASVWTVGGGACAMEPGGAPTARSLRVQTRVGTTARAMTMGRAAAGVRSTPEVRVQPCGTAAGCGDGNASAGCVLLAVHVCVGVCMCVCAGSVHACLSWCGSWRAV